MEEVLELDAAIVAWLNRGIGQVALLDQASYLVVGDYFIPLLISFWMLGLWFFGRDPRARERNQRSVLRGAIALGFANLAVLLLNQHFFRERPVSQFELANLLYLPTDSSFPAHPAAVSFAAAMGVWLGNRRVGVLLFTLASLWGLARVCNGVHYPTDVVAGAIIGILVAGVVALALNLIEPLPTKVLQAARFLHLA